MSGLSVAAEFFSKVVGFASSVGGTAAAQKIENKADALSVELLAKSVSASAETEVKAALADNTTEAVIATAAIVAGLAVGLAFAHAAATATWRKQFIFS